MMDLTLNVLVVDDFASIRRMVKSALEQIGFIKIFEAKDGSDALKMLKEKEIGLVLCDWNMPEMNGIDLLKAIKSDESLKDVPFILVTSEGHKNNVVEAVQAGVSNYIIKPFSAETLQEKIKKVLG